MIVRFKKLHPDAVVPFKKYPEDFCYDVVATSSDRRPGVTEGTEARGSE